MDDKKDKNIKASNTSQTIYNLAIFKDNGFNHIFNKTEKLATALYMITNFMSASEPLKWQIRDNSLKMLNAVMSLNKSSLSDRDFVMREITGYLFSVKSLFGVAYRAGFISQMNYEVVDNEITSLAEFISEYDSEKLSTTSPLFDEDFWSNASSFQISDDSKQKGHFNTKRQIIDKGQILSRPKVPTRTGIPNFVLKDIRAADLNSEISKKAKDLKINNRRETILKIIKDKKEVSVKDIAILITDCSEKTLQRELLALVAEGVLKKEGDRRWSRYSLS